mmetsp:Transcript_13720/g.43888  ORF Transcript_13720/g.43888 Transcript_13720/m.43888 type:complete len:229 (+) Transcript_13720:284-970(+)
MSEKYSSSCASRRFSSSCLASVSSIRCCRCFMSWSYCAISPCSVVSSLPLRLRASSSRSAFSFNAASSASDALASSSVKDEDFSAKEDDFFASCSLTSFSNAAASSCAFCLISASSASSLVMISRWWARSCERLCFSLRSAISRASSSSSALAVLEVSSLTNSLRALACSTVVPSFTRVCSRSSISVAIKCDVESESECLRRLCSAENEAWSSLRTLPTAFVASRSCL